MWGEGRGESDDGVFFWVSWWGLLLEGNSEGICFALGEIEFCLGRLR